MNIANIITLIRIVLVPFFIYHLYNKSDMHLTIIFFILCVLTDILDGFIARTLKIKSVIGALLDPLADKVLILSSYYVLGIFKDIPTWLFIIILGKEIIIISGWILIYILTTSYRVSVKLIGKTAVVFQMLTILVILLNIPYVNIFFYITGLLTIATTIDYCIHGAKQITRHYQK